MYRYHVDAFVPPAPGCGGKSDKGWDHTRCEQFAEFLNGYGQRGWRLHSCEYRSLMTTGCGAQKTTWLVCVFESQNPQ